MNPRERLGYSETSMWNFDALRQHPFLSTIGIEEQRNIFKIRSPLMFSLTPLFMSSPRNSVLYNNSVNTPVTPSPIRKQASFAADQKYLLVDWNQFLLKHESIVFMSIVYKKRKLSTKKRQLIMTDFPRLFYVDINSLEVKGTIPWSSDLKVELRSPKSFSIKTVSDLDINNICSQKEHIILMM